MKQFDRALALLLLLRGGKRWSAAALARHFAVSTRTIYRDIETLSVLGVPVYAEQGRNGGFTLLPGYFLPPVMLSTGEAVSILLGLALLRSLRARPFTAEMATAERKLLAIVPEQLRETLTAIGAIIGFEPSPDDLLHPEPSLPDHIPTASAQEGAILSAFLHAILDRRMVRLTYRSPYRRDEERHDLAPLGLFADRDKWYLVGRVGAPDAHPRVWRADRAHALTALSEIAEEGGDFDVRAFLGRSWLRPAMARWGVESPVSLRLTAAQAERLQRDWYYRHARYETQGDGSVTMHYGDDDRRGVFALLRWLGPGAELLAPVAWRAEFRAELAQILACYEDAG
jgi:predicted DNA-binding transcriptional regulator YafY